MDFEFSAESLILQEVLRGFMNRYVLPANAEWHRQAERGVS